MKFKHDLAMIGLSALVGPPIGVVVYVIGDGITRLSSNELPDAWTVVQGVAFVPLLLAIMVPFSYAFGLIPSVIASTLYCVGRYLIPPTLLKARAARFLVGGVLGAIAGWPFVTWVLESDRNPVTLGDASILSLALAVGLVSGGLCAVWFGKPHVSAA